MRIDRSTNNKINAEDNAIQMKSQRDKPSNKKSSDLSLISNKSLPVKDGAGESTTLRNFRETIKDVLEEITSLEINTMIVGRIPMKKFDAKEFYLDVIESIIYKTDAGMQDLKESLLERSAKLKQKGLSLPQQSATPLLPNEALLIDDYRAELTLYNQDLEDYKEAERAFNDRKNSLDMSQREQFIFEQACYEEISNQILKLDIKKDEKGELITDAPTIRIFRKLWELEQSVVNGDRIYAQTKFHLDGDLTNRFIDDLFIPSKSKIDPKVSQLIFDIHRQGVENAQKQWSGLITTCINLVKELMPFRK